MPIEIKTIRQFIFPTPQKETDDELAALLNAGWQIIALSHHPEETILEGDVTTFAFHRVVTLQIETTDAKPQLISKEHYDFADGQRVYFDAELDTNHLPLQKGDVGMVIKAKHDFDLDGVLFDRYDTVIYLRRVDDRIEPIPILDFCQPVPEEGK